MRIAIVQFPGSNCERETMLAVQRAGMEPVEFLWNQPRELLRDFAGYIIVGGFSYEDRARSGAIAALDPVMSVIREQSELGKPVLGICNGAQILVEAGFVPGLAGNKIGMALTDNKRMSQGQVLGAGFYNAWVHMRLTDDFQYNAFTRYLTPKNILEVPVAHAEGRFVIPLGLLMEMQHQGLGLFQYCDFDGNIIDEFPTNPNGSVNNIAAVTNKAGNVMAMMPHPERTSQGDAIFQSMRDYIHSGHAGSVRPLDYVPRPDDIKPFHLQKNAYELIIDMIITDNEAMSVQTALNHLGIPAQIKRQVHWEIECDSPDVFEKIIQSGVLFNDRKEMMVSSLDIKAQYQTSFLVRPKEDIIGQQKTQMLEHHFGIAGIRALKHGVLWNVSSTQAQADISEHVIQSHILFNPYAHDCYYY